MGRGMTCKQFGSFIVISLFGFLLAQSVAQAEEIQIKSKVIDINSSSNYLKIDRLDSSGEMKEIKVDVERSTVFEIYKSIQDIKIGDDVTIEADFNAFNHDWKALSIAPYNANSAQKILQTSAQNSQVSLEAAAPVSVAL